MTRRLHYAWIVAAVTFATLLLAGAIRGSPGLLVVPLESEFHWSRATISFAIGVNICLYGAFGPFAAAFMESFGLRRTMIAALAAIAVGVLLTTVMREAWQLILLWGVVVGTASGATANVLAATVAARWFAARRGLVVGMLTAGAAAGQLLLLPLFASIVVAHDWRWMTLVMAALALGLIPVVALFMRDWPQDIGRAAYGETVAVTAARPKPAIDNPISGAFKVLGAGLRSRDFWLLGGAYFICGASTNGLISTHLIPACLDHGIPEMTGAALLAAMAVFNFMGGIGSGWLTDRVDPRALLVVYYGLRGLSLIALPYALDSFYALSLFAIFFGLDWIASVPATIRITANVFGKRQAAIMFGWMSAIHQLGGAAAAFGGGILRTDLGSYLQAFMLSGILCLIAALMVIFISAEAKTPSGEPAIAPA